MCIVQRRTNSVPFKGDEDIPIGRGQFIEPRLPLRRILQPEPPTLELELPLAHQPPKTIDEVLAKALPQLDIVHQERFSATWLRRMAAVDPSPRVERRTAAGDQGVDVRMVAQPLVSCVQHLLIPILLDLVV